MYDPDDEFNQLVHRAETYEIGPETDDYWYYKELSLQEQQERDCGPLPAHHPESYEPGDDWYAYEEMRQEKEDERVSADKAWYRETRAEREERKVRRHYWE